MKGFMLLLTLFSASTSFAVPPAKQTAAKNTHSAAGCMACHQNDTASTNQELSNPKKRD